MSHSSINSSPDAIDPKLLGASIYLRKGSVRLGFCLPLSSSLTSSRDCQVELVVTKVAASVGDLYNHLLALNRWGCESQSDIYVSRGDRVEL